MQYFNTLKKIIVVSLTVCFLTGLLYVSFEMLYKKNQDVAIQNIDNEVDLDTKACTDDETDCHKNIEFFDDTWFQIGDENFDPIKLPKDIFEGQNAQE